MKTYTRGTQTTYVAGQKVVETHDLEPLPEPPTTYSEAFKWLHDNRDKMTDKELMSWIGTLGKLWQLKD